MGPDRRHLRLLPGSSEPGVETTEAANTYATYTQLARCARLSEVCAVEQTVADMAVVQLEAFLGGLETEQRPDMAAAITQRFATAPDPEGRRFGAFFAAHYALRRVVPFHIAARTLHILTRDRVPEVAAAALTQFELLEAIPPPDLDELTNHCIPAQSPAALAFPASLAAPPPAAPRAPVLSLVRE